MNLEIYIEEKNAQRASAYITSSMYSSVRQKAPPEKSQNIGGVCPMAKKDTYKNDRSFFVFSFENLYTPLST